MNKQKKFIGQSFILDFDGYVRKFKVVDIEFVGGLGPTFLMVSPLGNKFRLTKQELEQHDVASK